MKVAPITSRRIQRRLERIASDLEAITLLNTAEVARALKIDSRKVAKLLPKVQLGSKSTRYALSQVRDLIERRTYAK